MPASAAPAGDEHERHGNISPVKSQIVITGAQGLVGSVLRRELESTHHLTCLDARRIGPFRSPVGNATRPRVVRRAFEGQDVVIDLVAEPAGAPWKAIDRNNMRAAITVLEAARYAGVKRVILASTNHVTGLYELDPPYAGIVAGDYRGLEPGAIPLLQSDAPVRPDSIYGAGKAFGEALGRLYSEQYGLSVICLRIGTVNAENRPTTARHFATLLSHGDLIRLYRCSIEAPDEVRFGIFYGVSDNTWRFWDIADAGETIGYAPQDDAEAYR